MANLNGIQRVMVTGASGFLGGHVTARLMRAGVSVIGVGRNAEKLAGLGCDVLVHDIAQPLPEARHVDAIVHCAALSAPFGRLSDFMAANVDGTRHVVEFAARSGAARFVHVSTPSLYFTYKDQMDVAENLPLPRPVNHYAATKAMAEAIVLDQLAPKAIILRPRGIYGPGDTALLPRVLRAARQRLLPRLRGGQAAIDLTYVDDVVDAILVALRAPAQACGQAYNVSGGQVLSIQKIVNDACQLAGVTARWRPVPLPLAMGVARSLEAVAYLRGGGKEPSITRYGLGLFAYRQSLDLSKARDHLSWSPQVSFAQGLERTFGTGV